MRNGRAAHASQQQPVHLHASDLYELDPQEDIVKRMIRLCQPGAPTDELDDFLARSYPEIAPLQVGYRPTAPQRPRQPPPPFDGAPPQLPHMKPPAATHQQLPPPVTSNSTSAPAAPRPAHPIDGLYQQNLQTLAQLAHSDSSDQVRQLRDALGQVSSKLRTFAPELVTMARRVLVQAQTGDMAAIPVRFRRAL